MPDASTITALGEFLSDHAVWAALLIVLVLARWVVSACGVQIAKIGETVVEFVIATRKASEDNTATLRDHGQILHVIQSDVAEVKEGQRVLILRLDAQPKDKESPLCSPRSNESGKTTPAS